MAGLEILGVWLAFSLHVASAPAAVDEFPLTAIDAYGIPGVCRIFRWDGSTRDERGEAKAFTMATNDKRFETDFAGYRGEKAGVAFADGEAGREGGCRCRRLDTVVEEGLYVVRDVMVQPGKDSSGFVSKGGERLCKFCS